MADIPAANITLKERTLLGNKVLWKAMVKGDGTGVTIPVPLGRIEGYWTQSIDDATIPAPVISYATNILTYAVTPTINTYHWLFVIGTD